MLHNVARQVRYRHRALLVAIARACHRCSYRVRSTAPLYWIVTASNGGAVMAAAARLGGSLCHS